MKQPDFLQTLEELGMKPAVRNPAELQPWPRNYNEHPDAQVEQLQKSLDKKWKQYKNIVVWRDRIVCGEGLVKSALRSGKTQLVVNDVSHLSEADAEALMIADNALPAGAVPNPDILAQIFAGMPDPRDIPGVTDEWLAMTIPPVDDRPMIQFAADASPSLEGGESAVQGEGSQTKIPLPILVTADEYQRWQEYKQTIGVMNDSKAFMTLLQGVI